MAPPQPLASPLERPGDPGRREGGRGPLGPPPRPSRPGRRPGGFPQLETTELNHV